MRPAPAPGARRELLGGGELLRGPRSAPRALQILKLPCPRSTLARARCMTRAPCERVAKRRLRAHRGGGGDLAVGLGPKR